MGYFLSFLRSERSMLTHGESEIQDNTQTIANNRNQVKTIGFRGTGHDTTSSYEKRRPTNSYPNKEAPGKS
jgi:hypothetical protein